MKPGPRAPVFFFYSSVKHNESTVGIFVCFLLTLRYSKRAVPSTHYFRATTMKKQIVQVSILQSAKVMAALYFVISIPFALLMMIPAMLSPTPSIGIGMLIMMPIFYTIFGFLFSLLGAWIYNLVAARIGGFEFQTMEVAGN